MKQLLPSFFGILFTPLLGLLYPTARARKIYSRLFSCVLTIGMILFVNIQEASATHVMGSDISYKCTGTSGIFEVTLVIYRKCDGGASTLCPTTCGAPCPMTMQLQGADPSCSSTTFGSISLSLVSVRDVNINLACPTSKNACTNMGCVTAGTYTPAIERYEFKGFVNVGPTSGIPASCCNVRFSWSLCCRNSNIQTGAADQNFYVDAIINRCYSVSPCNSSPELTNDPIAIICGGENYVFNNGAVDPNLDSLSYSFTPALQGFGSAVTYNPPFSFDKPMPWTGNFAAPFPAGIHCDPNNGDIMFTPPNPGSLFAGVLAVEIKQWKQVLVNGVPTMVVMGVTRRDIQMTVRGDCLPNNPPKLITNPTDTNPSLPKTNWFVCAGNQLCFTVAAKDTDFNPPTISDTTYLSWNSSLATFGATFNPDYAIRYQPGSVGREDRYKFCWTPDISKISTTPYYFSVTAKDSRCPNPGRLTQVFSITVNGMSPITNNIISAPQTICSGDTPITLTGSLPSGGAGIFNYYWQSAPSASGNWNNIASTQNYSPGSVKSDTWYRRYLTSGICALDTSPSIKITTKRNIISVQGNPPISIAYGSTLSLPDSAFVTYSDSTIAKLAVNWNIISYTGNAGNHNLLGTPNLINGTCNTSGLKSTISVTVLKSPMTISAQGKTKVYGEPDPAFSYIITNGALVGNDTFVGNLARTSGNAVGKYAINQGTLQLGNNYTVTFVGDSLTITPKPITVTAQPKSIIYGNIDPLFTYSNTLLVPGDTFTGSLSRSPGVNIGKYAIGLGTLQLNNNYIITYTGDSLTITPKQITVTTQPKTMAFGDTDPPFTYSNNLLVTGDTFTGSLSRSPGVNVGKYAIGQGTLSLNNNYTVAFVSDSLTILPRTVVVTANAKAKLFGAFDPALTFQLTSGTLIGSDTFTGTLTRTTGENIGKYAITKGSLFISANYNIQLITDSLTIRITSNPTGGSSFCNGDSITLNANAGIGILYQWLNNNLPISGATSNNYSSKLPGSFRVVGKNNSFIDTSASIDLNFFPKAHAGFTINNDTQCYIANAFVFTDTSHIDTGSFSRLWVYGDGTADTSSVSTKSFTKIGVQTVKLILLSDHGCRDSLTQNVLLPANNTIQPICLVTIDSATNKNKIVWERMNKPGHTNYLVYKETNVSNVYSIAGMIPADSIGVFIDTLSNPDAKSDRYRLASIDTCGNESQQSPVHKPIHLTVNLGSNNAWNLIWESYQGLPTNTINIFRGNSLSTLSLIQSVQGSINFYTDLTPPPGHLYYIVSTDFGVSCDPARLLKTTYQSSQSNIVYTLSTGIAEFDLLDGVYIYPNPIDDNLFISTSNNKDLSVKIYDGIGKLAITSELQDELSVIDMRDFTSGVYFVEVKSFNGVKYQKIIKK